MENLPPRSASLRPIDARTTIAEVMTTCPHTIGVRSQRDLYFVEAMAGVDRVVDKKRVVGIFTATNALALLARAMS